VISSPLRPTNGNTLSIGSRSLRDSIDKNAESYEKPCFRRKGKKMFADFVAARKAYGGQSG
jgi:hypothetical protein